MQPGGLCGSEYDYGGVWREDGRGEEGDLRLDTFIIIFCEREFLSRGISDKPSEM